MFRCLKNKSQKDIHINAKTPRFSIEHSTVTSDIHPLACFIVSSVLSADERQDTPCREITHSQTTMTAHNSTVSCNIYIVGQLKGVRENEHWGKSYWCVFICVIFCTEGKGETLPSDFFICNFYIPSYFSGYSHIFLVWIGLCFRLYK